ncbi:MAG TPA: DUF3429 domain-containing protein [Acidiphilium sp.]|nr:MAG: DUF3429 domain-containing protein [Acidiphilium sp. 21-60-14]OYV91151.1 MAG: DUF3429 domain-containing protein [Acidiphilium sp. 37-60-79]OZB39938.1 MAG: DUF3429 domain-containing protein [Acidiphilium sp. 34-60-192]HQT87027.1 DUF3429 domain-containing protein [Acidiphilium sp.]HQU22926.1 DUF3429 domain-containing protein [Acidiphilium sp.]
MTRTPMMTATLLGLAGTIPFIALLAIVATRPLDAPVATISMIDYGAVILSFLGAVHWGFALEPGGMVRDARTNDQRLVFGVLPALMGFVALLAVSPLGAPRLALAVLIAGFFATILAETVGKGRDLVPAKYLVLRWVVSLVVLVVLVATLFITLVGMRQA